METKLRINLKNIFLLFLLDMYFYMNSNLIEIVPFDRYEKVTKKSPFTKEFCFKSFEPTTIKEKKKTIKLFSY